MCVESLEKNLKAAPIGFFMKSVCDFQPANHWSGVILSVINSTQFDVGQKRNLISPQILKNHMQQQWEKPNSWCKNY